MVAIVRDWSTWHQIEHYLGVDGVGTGAAGFWYSFWSGWFSDLTIFVTALMLLWHFTCHKPSCFRPGRHPIAGGRYKVCAKHHPEIKGKRPTLEEIHQQHREHQALLRGESK